MGNLWPAVVGLLVALPSAAIAYLAYRRGMRADAVAATATVATVQSGSVAQVIDGLNALVAALQTDNRTLRKTIERLEARVILMQDAIDRLEKRVTKNGDDFSAHVKEAG